MMFFLVFKEIDIVVSPEDITIGSLLAAVRASDIVSVHQIARGDGEAMEIIVHGDSKTSKLVTKLYFSVVSIFSNIPLKILTFSKFSFKNLTSVLFGSTTEHVFVLKITFLTYWCTKGGFDLEQNIINN